MKTKQLAIGPSCATFTRGASVLAESNNSCPRFFLARKNGFRTEFDELYTAMGAIDEHRFMRKWLRENPETTIETQINIDKPLSDKSKIYGFLDMKITYPDGTEVLVEKKSHISKNARLNIIRKHKVKMSHLAQLVTYMMLKGISRGAVICDYYEFDKECETLKRTEGTEFGVILREDRSIEVDGKVYPYDQNDLAKFYKIIDNAIQNDPLPSRPGKVPDVYGTPCAYCPLREKCDEAEIRGLDKNGFLALVKDDESRLIEQENSRRKPAQVWAPALRKKRGTV